MRLKNSASGSRISALITIQCNVRIHQRRGRRACKYRMGFKTMRSQIKEGNFEAAIAEAEKPAPMGFGFGPPRKAAPNPLKGKKPEDLDIIDGMIVLKSDNTKGVPLKSLTSNVYATFAGCAPNPVWPSKYDLLNTLYCEVAVDEENR